MTDCQARADGRTSTQVEFGQRASASSVLLELHRDIGMSCEGWSSADCSPISQQPCDRHRDEPVKLRSLSRPRAKARFRTLAKTSTGTTRRPLTAASSLPNGRAHYGQGVSSVSGICPDGSTQSSDNLPSGPGVTVG